MHPCFRTLALTNDKKWQPGPHEGVELDGPAPNESTGGVVVLPKFKTGCTVSVHAHPDANEWAYVLAGEWEESKVTYPVGTRFHARKGVRRGPQMSRTELINLTTFDRPLTVT
jgi:hypothetical protein